MNEAKQHDGEARRPPKRLATIGGALLVIILGGRNRRFSSRGISFWIGITRCMALLMVQHLTGGNWALVIRRILEAGSRTLPLMAIAVLPVLAGMKSLYSWSLPEQTDPVILAKHLYLNPGFFVARTIFYFACWFFLVYLLNKFSRAKMRVGNSSLWMRLKA
jgi:hypothetical protein